jgi:multiple sugar transport system permease protein
MTASALDAHPLRDGLATRVRSIAPAYRRRVLWALMLPAVICELAVYVVPIVAGIYTSFLQVDQFTIRNWFGAPFIGLDNYINVVANPVIGGPLLRSLFVSLLYVVCVVVLSLLIGFAATVFVRSLRRAKALQIFFIIPYAVPVYAGVLAWAFCFQGSGAVNSLLGTDILWLQGNQAFFSMVVTAVWRTWPFVFLLMLASTSSISPELFEALRVDGGGRWAETRHIILPHVQAQLGVLALLLFIWTFNDFVTPFVFYGQVAPVAGNLFPLNVYTTTFVTFAYSFGSAVTLMAVILLSLFIVFPYLRVTRLGEAQA